MNSKVVQRIMKWGSIGLLIGLTLIIFGYNQWSLVMADPDSFYHMKISQLLWEQGVITDFRWLPFTTLGEFYIDQHLLYHALMVPFVVFGNAMIGVKIFTVIGSTAAIASVGLLLRSLKLRWWWPVTVVMMLTVSFSFRLQLVKANALSIVVLCIIIWCLTKRRYVLLALISAVFVWLYGGFFLAIPVVGLWLGSLVIDRFFNHGIRYVLSHWKEIVWPLLALCIGIAIGVVLNPYFPNNLSFYWEQFVQIGIVNYSDDIGVGAEWYSYQIYRLVFDSVLLFSLVGLGLAAKIVQRSKWKALDWFALGLFIFGLVLTIKSRRYVEYFGPFAAIAAAIWLNSIRITVQDIVRGVMMRWRTAFITFGTLTLVIVLVLPVVLNDLRNNVEETRDGDSLERYRAGSEWLADRAPYNSIVLHSDWDDFPVLFYHNSNVRYINGLDPTFMYRHNESLYWLWVDITLGDYEGNIETAVNNFDARYIFIESNHVAMYNLFNRSSAFDLIYKDDEVDIFEVKEK